MSRREKQKEVFIELVNKQLEPHGKCYEDVANDPDWYMHFKTTREKEDQFINWGVKLLREKLKLNKKAAELEMSWFILQWGLTTNPSLESIENVVSEKERKTEKGK
jgi:hypothetical protein